MLSVNGLDCAESNGNGRMVNPASPMKETLKPVGTLNVSRGQNLEE